MSMVSFAVQKHLSSIRPHLFILPSFPLLLEMDQKKILLRFMSNSVLPMFSSRSFMVSGIIFSSLTHCMWCEEMF